MDKKKQSADVSFALKKIVTTQFAIIEEAYKEKKPVSMNLSLSFAVNKETRIIEVSAKVNFAVLESPFVLIEVGCFFAIKKESWDTFMDEKGEKRVPKGFLCHLSMHTIGTLRGVLHAKTENTPFNRFILPPINVNELVKEDLIL